jgi:ribosomal protein S18 acetylase RimI-like enzyme
MEFYSGATGLPGRFSEGFLLRRLHLLVYSIAVLPSEQGLGHGSALLDFADRCAVALGLGAIRLYTNVRMEKNIAFYRRHGYTEIGTRPHPSRSGEMLVDMARTVPFTGT